MDHSVLTIVGSPAGSREDRPAILDEIRPQALAALATSQALDPDLRGLELAHSEELARQADRPWKRTATYHPLRTSADLSGTAIRVHRQAPAPDLAPYVYEFCQYDVDPVEDYVPVQVGIAVQELRDLRIHMDLLWPNQMRTIEERIETATTFAERV